VSFMGTPVISLALLVGVVDERKCDTSITPTWYPMASTRLNEPYILETPRGPSLVDRIEES
jgi:hypothetical protein